MKFLGDIQGEEREHHGVPNAVNETGNHHNPKLMGKFMVNLTKTSEHGHPFVRGGHIVEHLF
jgi:hypothetical protein